MAALLSRSKKGNDAFLRCEGCRRVLLAKELEKNARVCPNCGKHYRLPASERIAVTFDPGSFEELDAGMISQDPLEFPEYREKLDSAIAKTGRQDSIVRGRALLEGVPVAAAVSDFAFMGGSMGAVAGEKVTRTLELAADEKIPAIIFTATGGARMQEGLFSLMQMAKTSAACERLARAGVPFICVFSDPTMAGVLASYASLADVILAEPEALVGFAGARVAAQAAQGGKMPEDFQTSEFNLRVGMIDKVVDRKEMRHTLARLVRHLGGNRG
ncbi:MAG: acetyl-CoA carboxylase, carboxyltransferase subunit beta [Fimbriimonadales bacterium]